METTITREEINRAGWTCPTCGWDMMRAGEPNAPEVAICRNDECPTGMLTVIDEEG